MAMLVSGASSKESGIFMHVFLQGPRGVGKSTVIRKTMDMLMTLAPLVFGGFYTWNGGNDDPHIYLKAAMRGREDEIYRIASFDEANGGLISDIQVFEREGARLLNESGGADVIIMDELGFIESNAPKFRHAVMDRIAGSIPVFGVLRMGDIPWHADIKRHPLVTLFDVMKENRDSLPQSLASCFAAGRLISNGGQDGYTKVCAAEREGSGYET